MDKFIRSWYDPRDGGFEIVVGERRFRAAKLVGLPTLKATVRELNDVAAQRVSLAENLGREDLNAFEETVGLLATPHTRTWNIS